MAKKNLPNKPLKKILYLFDNKFKFEIIYLLVIKKRRFGELKIEIENITQQLLTKVLKDLVRDRIIDRNQYNGFPRKVEYSLTPFGNTLKPIINIMFKWEEKNIKTINKHLKKKKMDSLYDYY